MKTTLEYIKLNTRTEGNTVICDLVSKVRYDKVKHMEQFVQMEEVAQFLKKNCDAKGNYIIHTRGTATCSPEDKFDFETGKRIAHTRAQLKAFYKADDFYSEIVDRATRDIENTALNCCLSGGSCAGHIEDLIEGTYNK